ncbi:hypothetical protein FOZ61_000909 [Perkinsus olseni]|uniref:Uncharacterized protein n=1 Tax=Perkinsus olseni TaxID=32597 RepID=A0A7J6KSJ0_PEROL|nr:hypothetical protein FOZ61_000909 [Perkinsus olseni]
MAFTILSTHSGDDEDEPLDASDRDADGDDVSDDTDYPPKTDRSYFDVKESLARCFYLDENIAGHFGELDIFVRETKVQTEEIGCPETETHPAFRAAYSKRHLLVNYRIKNSSTVGPWHVFDEPPPDETGLDPLRSLDQSSFILIKDRLFAAVKRLGLPQNLEMTKIYKNEMDTLLEHALRARKTIVNYLLKVCDSVISAIKEQYGSYRQLCVRNYHDAQGAIDAARDAGWSFEPDRHDILVKPPVKT